MTTKKNAPVGAGAQKENDADSPLKPNAADGGSATVGSADRAVGSDVAMRHALQDALHRGLDAHWLVPAVLGEENSGKRPAALYRDRPVHSPADAKRLWAEHRPGYGLGMRPGGIARVVVIDGDPPKAAAALKAYRAEAARLLSPDGRTVPPPTVRTGGGGEQWHVRWPEGVPLPAGAVPWSGTKSHEELRLLGAGGNVVLPPTLHWTGKRYDWAEGSVLDATPALIEAASAPAPTDDAGDLLAEPFDLDDMPARLRAQIEAAGATADRSKGIYRAVLLMREHRYSPEQALWLISDSDLPFCSKAAELGDAWAAKEVRRLWRKGADKKLAEAQKDFAKPTANKQAAPTARFVLKKASDAMSDAGGLDYSSALGVACPVGVVMIAGMGGTGKSTIAATFATHVTTGQPCPPWEAKAAQRAPAGVLWLTTEEDLHRIVLPRHAALGGDMDLLFVHEIATELDENERPKAVNFDVLVDLAPLLEQARRAGTPVRLVVCDTLPSLVNWDGRSPNSDTDVKLVMSSLKDVALAFDCCVLGVSHLNKKADADDEFRMAGAQSWRESPRLSFLCKAGYIFVNKTNDGEEVGCSYEHEVVKVLYEIPAEMKRGGPMKITARRARFGPVLLDKPEVLELVKLALDGTKKEQRDEKPKRPDRMKLVASECFELIGDGMPAALLWREVERECGTTSNGAERKAVLDSLGLRSVRRGSKHFVERLLPQT